MTSLFIQLRKAGNGNRLQNSITSTYHTMFIIYKNTIEDVFQEAESRPLYLSSHTETGELYRNHLVTLGCFNSEGRPVMWRYNIGSHILHDTAMHKSFTEEATKLRTYIEKTAAEKGLKVSPGVIATQDKAMNGFINRRDYVQQA